MAPVSARARCPNQGRAPGEEAWMSLSSQTRVPRGRPGPNRQRVQLAPDQRVHAGPESSLIQPGSRALSRFVPALVPMSAEPDGSGIHVVPVESDVTLICHAPFPVGSGPPRRSEPIPFAGRAPPDFAPVPPHDQSSRRARAASSAESCSMASGTLPPQESLTIPSISCPVTPLDGPTTLSSTIVPFGRRAHTVCPGFGFLSILPPFPVRSPSRKGRTRP